MTSVQRSRFGRRDFLRRGALFGAVAGTGSVAGGAVIANAVSGAPGGGLVQLDPPSEAIDYIDMTSVRVMATDGFFSYPGRRHAIEPIFGFGFRAADDQRLVGSPAHGVSGATGELNANPGDLISKYKGKVLQTAPTIVAIEGDEFAIVVTNLGLVIRPDLDDAHSLHWHGFRNATAVFDGVPETSISVPSGRDLPYFFHPKMQQTVGQPKGSAGTYMYHCHFEDVEHVQMGMVGMIFVEPRDMWFEANGTTPRGARLKTAYNLNTNVDSSFDREFALLMNELDYVPHDNLRDVQEFVWSDYNPKYFTMNGRSYPDTVIPQITPSESVGLYAETLQMPALGTAPDDPDQITEGEMKWQHNSSLVQCMEGDRVLLRLANLGYEIHSIELVGAGDMHVVANDASLLVGASGTSDLTYHARRLEIGPGEARDAILTAPDFDISAEVVTDDLAFRNGMNRVFNRYILKSRNNHRNSNDGTTFGDGVSYAGAGDHYGGMVTELWVYPDSALAKYQPGGTDESAAAASSAVLPVQTQVNETYPTLVVPAGHV